MRLSLCKSALPEWERVKLESICKRVTSGGTPSRSRKDFYGGEIPWVKTKELNDDWIHDTEEKISVEGLKGSSAKMLAPNSVIIAMYGATVGQLGILKYPSTCNQACCVFEVDESRYDYMYLFYMLLFHKAQIKTLSTGAAQQNLSAQQIKNFILPFPELEKQKKIAFILSSLDDKTRNNKLINSTLESIAQALFKSWFVDFDPVRAKVEAIGYGEDPQVAAMQAISGKSPEELQNLSPENHQKLAATAALFPDELIETEHGEIPMGWELSTIGDETSIYGGGTPSTKEESYWNGTNWWATPKDMSKLSDKILVETDRKISEEGVLKISSGVLPVNTVLMSSRAPVGYLAISKIPISINQGFIAMVCDKVLSSEYVVQWAEQRMDEIIQRASGTTFLEISKKNFKPLSVLVPSGGVLKEYTRLVSPYYEMITVNMLANKRLAEMRDSLIPKLLNGDLKV